jgi:hypothetical protein
VNITTDVILRDGHGSKRVHDILDVLTILFLERNRLGGRARCVRGLSPTAWRGVPLGNNDGIAFMGYNDRNAIVWNFPIEISFQPTSPQGWSRLVVRVRPRLHGPRRRARVRLSPPPFGVL